MDISFIESLVPGNLACAKMPRCFMAKKLKYPYEEWKARQEDGAEQTLPDPGELEGKLESQDEEKADAKGDSNSSWCLEEKVRNGDSMVKGMDNLKKGGCQQLPSN